MNARKVSVLIFVFVCAIACIWNFPAHAQPPKALLLFGGKDHKTFLGCLNCTAASSSSVCNVAGDHGSIVATNSIWNIVGDFGSIVSDESPWNVVASHPPVIVDRDGNSYGYFTENVAEDQTRIAWLVKILDYYSKEDDLDGTRDLLCED